MHKILQSYLDQFSREFEITAMDEADRFERFVNYCIISKYYPEILELDAVTTEHDDWSIDGVAFIIGEQLVLTEEEAQSAFENLRPRQNISVNYLIIQAKRTDGFDGGEITKFGSGALSLLADPNFSPVDNVLVEARKIHDIIISQVSKVQGGRPTCTLYYATSGMWHAPVELTRMIAGITRQLDDTGFFTNVEFHPIGRENLFDLWMQTRNPVEATFLIKGSIPIPDIAGVEEAYLTVVSAKEFVDKVLTDSDGRIRSYVFEQNVRAFLGEGNPVNSRMNDALASTDNQDRFAILNNGITIVSPDVRSGSGRLSVFDFQIVNGCQTSHVLFRNRELLSDKVHVSVKVIEVQDPTIVSEIVQATNSQSNVGDTQFLSLNPFVRRIESFFSAFDNEHDRDKRLYFERRTRQYADDDIGRNRVFDIQRLARAFAAMFLDVPHLAARYPTLTLKERATELYQAEHRELAYYTAAFALYRLENALGNDYVPRALQNQKWHLLMAMKYIVGGKKAPSLSSPRLDKYCHIILESLEGGGKASAAPFLRAADFLDRTISRDRLKGRPFTDELKNRVTS